GYAAGTVVILRNGQVLLHPGGNMWTETDPSAGVVTMADPPLAGDVIVGWALPAVSVPDDNVIQELQASVDDFDAVDGEIDDPTTAVGELLDFDAVDGEVDEPSAIDGEAADVDALDGLLEEC